MPDFTNLEPDFDGIKDKLHLALQQKPAWAGRLTTQTGTTLVDLIATIGANAQLAILRAKQDAFPETAMSDRALYANADAQGIRISRKLPASVTTKMRYDKPSVSSADMLTIQPFEQFQGAGTYWFTKQAYVLPNGSDVDVTLYQGYIVSQEINGLGTDYQTFVTAESDFSVSDTDVFVFINGTQITVTSEGLWNYKSQKAVQDRTTPEGRLRLLFGTDNYGAKPTASDLVRIVYAVTSGYNGNGVTTIQQRINMVTPVTGVTVKSVTVNPTGGADQPPPNILKTVGATSFGTNASAVTPRQYRALALEFPGVLDCKLFSQRELNPGSVSLMNTIKAVPLGVNGPLDVAAKAAFIDYMQQRSMFTPYIYVVDPQGVVTNVVLRVFCYNWATLSECSAAATSAVTALFAPRSGFLGYNITLSDIVTSVVNSNPGIEYVQVLSPTRDLWVSGEPAPAPSISMAATGGTLSGQVSYAIAVIDGNGETLPTKWASAFATSGIGVATLTWNPYPGATSYKIYGRTDANAGLMATLAANVLTYTDDGSLAVTPGVPKNYTYGVWYNKLGTLQVTADYSTRSSTV